MSVHISPQRSLKRNIDLQLHTRDYNTLEYRRSLVRQAEQRQPQHWTRPGREATGRTFSTKNPQHHHNWRPRTLTVRDEADRAILA